MADSGQAMRGASDTRERDEAAAEELLDLVSQYKAALLELTFNSKPIITNLTIIAGENAHAAYGITKTICDHIVMVPKEQKLPSLYLLDSIVKNIGGEYVKYFAARLPEVFVKAYRHVDPSLYTAMQHLFWTWRGVFPSVPLRTIETELRLNPKPGGPVAGNQASRPVEPSVRPAHGIHVNPKYLDQRQLLQQSRTTRANEADTPEINGDGLSRQDRGAVRANSKGWPETHRSATGNISRDRFDEPGFNIGPLDFPEYKFERRGLLRPDTGDTGEGNGASDERIQRYPHRNGYDARLSSGARPLGADGQGYNRPPGLGRGGSFSVSQSVDVDGRGRGEVRGRRIDPRMVEGPDGSRTQRLGIGSEGGDGRDYRLECRIPGRGIGGRGVRMDSRTMGPDGRSLGLDSSGVGAVRGTGLGNRGVRPDTSGLGAGSQGLRLDRDGGGVVGGRGSWQNEDEEEYVWDDMKPLVRDPDDRTGDGKVDEWRGGDRDMRRGGSSNRPGLESGGELEDWRRMRRRESEERGRLAVPQSGHGPRVMPEPDVELMHSTQSRLPILQSSLPNFSMPLVSPNVLPGSGGPPVSSLAAAGPGQVGQGQYGVRQSYPPTAGLLALGNLAQPLLQQQMQDEQTLSSRELPPSISLPQVPSVAVSQLPLFPLSQQAATTTVQIAPMPQQTGQLGSGGVLNAFSQHLQGAVATLHGQQNQANQYQQPTGAVSGLANRQSDVLPLNPAAISELLKLVQQLPGPQNQTRQQQQAVGVSQSQSQSVAAGQGLQSGVGVPPMPNGPPPAFLQAAVYNPAILQGGQYAAGQSQVVAGSMAYSSQQQGRVNQPPLPPGPPPASALARNPVSQYDTLFKSLMAQGLISAGGSTATTSGLAVGMNVLGGMNGGNGSSGFFNPGGVQSTGGQTFSLSTALVSSVGPVTDNAGTGRDGGSRGSEYGVAEDPVGTEFKAEVLRERHEVVIDALYSDFPRQCKTCGLRFLEQNAHSKHMDWHVSRNRRQKSQKKVSRKWFVSEKEWLSGTAASTTEAAPSFFAAEGGAGVAKVEEGETVAVPADYNQIVCALCGEPFDDFYSDEKDEWMYKGAVYMNDGVGGGTEGMDSGGVGPIVHAKCQTESAATAGVTEESEEVQPELMAADSVRMEVDGGGGDDSAMPLLDNFDSLESKDENSELESRKKRVRY